LFDEAFELTSKPARKLTDEILNHVRTVF
jgi:hypothetical protein